MTMSTVWKDGEGNLINVGEWDYGSQVVDWSDPENPLLVFDEFGAVMSNPLPEGAVRDMVEIITTQEGRIVVQGDYRAYPALSARQLRLGLINGGISLVSVTAVIEAIPDVVAMEKAMVEWEYATSYTRDHALISAVGGALGLSAEQTDVLWFAAVAL